MLARSFAACCLLLTACASSLRVSGTGSQQSPSPAGAVATATATGTAATTPAPVSVTGAPAAPAAAAPAASGAPDLASASAACGSDPQLAKERAAADAIAPSAAANGSGADLCIGGAPATCVAEYLILLKTNAVRALHDLPPFAFSAKVSFVARDWSTHQAQTNVLSHDGWPAARETAYAAKFHDVLRSNAENVAMEPTASVDDMAAEAVDAWICSSGHRENILGKGSELGIGVACNADTCYATQIFGYD